MDVRNSSLVIAVYVILALCVILLVFVGFSGDRRTIADLEATVDGMDPRNRTPSTVRDMRRSPSYLTQQRHEEETRRKVDQLEALLAKRSALLREKDQLLEKRTSQYQRLREEADQYLALAIDTLAQDSASAARAAQLSSQEADMETQRELERLRQELADNDLVEQGLQLELETSRRALDELYAQIANSALGQSSQADQAIQSQATNTLVLIGAPAVRPLADALDSERAEVRQWSARALGQIGGDAVDAIDALILALEDDNRAVRDAAHEALLRIEEDL